MKTWMRLSVVFAMCAFLICPLLGNRAFAAESSMLAQQNQAGPSRTPSKQLPPTPQSNGKQPLQTPPPSKQLPPTTPSPSQHPTAAPRPSGKPLPPTRVPVDAPPGMTMCVFTNSDGIQIAIIVPEGSICVINADGSDTVIFPDGTTFTVPAYASEGIFYTSNHDPVIIVPYYNSTVTLVPDDGYRVTFPDGRVYFLPIPGRGNPFFWFFPSPPPLPIPSRVPVVQPANTVMYVFTNANGDQIAIFAPLGSTFTLNNDGSVTIHFPNGTTYTVPYNATNESITTSFYGYHVVVVPYLGTTIVQFGDTGYYITLPDGTSYWDTHVYTIFQHPPGTTTLPPELGIQRGGRFTFHIGGLPPFDYVYDTVGMPGIISAPDGLGNIWITFPGGFTTSLGDPPAPGAYSAQQWVDTPAPGHWVTYHFAIVIPGSTITSLGNGWYHVEPPAGSGGQPFDFQYP